MANAFNENFSAIGPKHVNEIPSAANGDKSCLEYLNITDQRFCFTPSNSSQEFLPLNKLSKSKQPVLIKYAQEFLLSLQSFSFTPTIDRPTRVHNSSATLFDNILTNKVDANITSGNIVSDISDHFSQFCVSHTFFKKLKSKKQKRRDFSGFSVNSFNSELSEELLNQNNFDDQFVVDISFPNFYNALSGLVEKHAPMKTLSKRKLKQFSKPWITIGLKKSIKVKNSLFQSGAKHIISGPLSNICNISVQEGVFPSNLKQAKVIPVYKSENETEPGNYRPISLLSIFNRIFEKLMYRQPKNFLNKHDILFKLRYRFREKHSTQHTVIDIVNIMQNNMDLKLFTCGIFLDLKKAFDTVNHSILLKKINHCGIRGIINDWFSSYLLGRSQVTEIDSNLSTINKISCGVLQGSVLGPLLFLIYITLQRNFRFTSLLMTQICCMPTKIVDVFKKRSITNWSESRIGSMQIS